MSKVFPAACVAGVVVTTDVPPKPVLDAVILSQGVGPSEGFAIIGGKEVFYVPNIAPDLAATLNNLISVLTSLKSGIDKIADTLTDIGGNMTGDTTSPPPTLGASVTTIKGYATAIGTIKTTLNTLSGALR